MPSSSLSSLHFYSYYYFSSFFSIFFLFLTSSLDSLRANYQYQTDKFMHILLYLCSGKFFSSDICVLSLNFKFFLLLQSICHFSVSIYSIFFFFLKNLNFFLVNFQSLDEIFRYEVIVTNKKFQFIESNTWGQCCCFFFLSVSDLWPSNFFDW